MEKINTNKSIKCKPNDKKCISRNRLLILADLYKANRPLSIKQISQRNKVTWKTANSSIKKLEEKRLVSCDRSKRRTYCKVSNEALKSLGKINTPKN